MRSNASGNKPQHHLNNSSSSKQFGIFVGKVKSIVDKEGLGRLQVWIPQLSTAKEDDPTSWFTMRYCPPFAGATDTKSESTAKDSKIFPETNQSYGMWFPPPTKNVQVICGFINGEITQGIWWAMLPQDGHTHALPAVASGSTHDGKIKPVAERNRHNVIDKQSDNRPEHPASFKLSQQGLDLDLRRGQSNAGPFRNKEKHPGLAYGILTPGQHSVMLDDGDDGVSGAIRLRTNTGHQIVMHEEGGFIHVINANGSAWFQLDHDGNIDFFAAGDFSVHAENNINFHAGNNFNIDAGNNINGVGRNNVNLEACETMNVTGTNGTRITSWLGMDILAAGSLKQTAQRIDLNGPPALPAELPAENSHFTNSKVGRSVSGRVPEHEPWGGHGKLNGGEQITTPAGFVPNLLEKIGEVEITPAPESYDKDNIPPATSDAELCIPTTNLDTIVMSETAFNMMKSREAYRGMMYADFQGYSIGYGTRIDIFGPGNPASKIDEQLKQALISGPSESEARLISRQIIDRHVTPPLRAKLKQAIAGRNVCITQSVFDALCMAAYGNPAQSYAMAESVVDSGARTADGKPTNGDIAKIWANSAYSNSSNQRNAEAQFAMTGAVPASVKIKTPEQLMKEGVSSDNVAVAKGRARNPAYPWKSKLGNGPQTGQRVDASYGKPTPDQLAQWERSYYLNTGQPAPGSALTVAQLDVKYGSAHKGENTPPNTPTQVV